jgi:hypothetical protein
MDNWILEIIPSLLWSNTTKKPKLKRPGLVHFTHETGKKIKN